MKKFDEKIDRIDLKHETFLKIRAFGDSPFNGKIKSSNLLEVSYNLMIKLDLDQKQISRKKRNAYESIFALYECWELILNAFKSGIFSLKLSQGKGINVLSPKQIIQRLPIALAQLKAVKNL